MEAKLNRKQEKEQHRPRVRVFTEEYITKGVKNASAYADISASVAISAERCRCADPTKCVCRPYMPPSLRFHSMSKKEFYNPKPFLLYTVQRGENESTRFTFACKSETDVFDYVCSLNSKEKDDTIWTYNIEDAWNEAAIAEYREYQIQQGEYEKLL